MRKPYLFLMICIFMSHMSLHAEGVNGVNIHGFLSQGYLISSDNNYFAETKDGSFQFNEMGINFSSKLTPKLRVGLQFFAYDLGDLGNDEVSLDWVFGDYHWQEWLGIRVGKIKIPLGLYNEVRDVDLLRTFIKLPQSVYSERYRDTWVAMKGIGLYGKVGSDLLGTLGYQIQMGSMRAGKDSGDGKQLESLTGFYEVSEDFDVSQAYAGKLEWQMPGIPLRLAASALKYDFDGKLTILNAFSSLPPAIVPRSLEVHTDDFIVWVVSMEYTWENLMAVFEYSEINYEAFVDSPLGPLIHYDNTIPGYYGSISYRFQDFFELGAYYSIYYINDKDKDGELMVSMYPFKENFQAWAKDACLTARFDINRHWIFKLEGHVMNGAADLFDMINLDEDTPIAGGMPNLDIEEDWFLFGVKLSYFF